MNIKKRLTRASVCVASLFLSGNAFGLAGTHATPVSTWDTRASTVVAGFRYGVISGGQLLQASYNANFTSTSGNLSAQFGVHYMNFQNPEPAENGETRALAHGISGTTAAVFSLPIAERHSNGNPLVAFGFYVGGAPTALVGGQYTYITVPLTFGVALPYSPHPIITLTPSFEVAPSVNLDTSFVPTNITLPPDLLTNPESINLSSDQVAAIVSQGLQFTVSARVNMRAGLEAILHAGDNADFNFYFYVGSLDSTFQGPTVAMFGGSLVLRWDDIVPSVLPAERRLEHVDCKAIETRFKECPGGQRWQQLEERFQTERQRPRPRAGQPGAAGVQRAPNRSGFPYGDTAEGPAPAASKPKPEAAPVAPVPTPSPAPTPAPNVEVPPPPTGAFPSTGEPAGEPAPSQ